MIYLISCRLILLVAALILRRRWLRNKAMTSVQKVELGGRNNDELHSHSVRSGSHGTRDLIWTRAWPNSGHSHGSSHRNGALTTSQKEAELEAQKALLPQGAPPEYAELLSQHVSHPAESNHLSLSSFLPRRSNSNSNTNSSSSNNNLMAPVQTPPSAYATTTLVNPSARNLGVPAYASKSASTESSNSGSYALEHLERSRKNSNNSFSPHQRIPNWADLLPPPPRHPPPPSPAPNSDRDVSKTKPIKKKM